MDVSGLEAAKENYSGATPSALAGNTVTAWY